ncbi:hypothetical protein GE061_005410 [Apolygus lucorum]|uniref:LIM zinc-binding domain-containing protein n=1 Tax=Apolygus lucorum TaxID=248454 RepID=A0A8S9WWA0_APOLU|nr:hypothetical protein GE061_005410 [Apolygus lucorum]
MIESFNWTLDSWKFWVVTVMLIVLWLLIDYWEMAEVAKSVVSETGRPDESEEVSLQQLIENELALRAPSKTHAFTRDFILHERQAANGAVYGDSEEWTTVETVAMEIQNDVVPPKNAEPKINGDAIREIPVPEIESETLISLESSESQILSHETPLTHENGHVESLESPDDQVEQDTPPDIQDDPFAVSLENHSVVLASPGNATSDPEITPETVNSSSVTSYTVVTETKEVSSPEIDFTASEIVSDTDFSAPEIVSVHESVSSEDHVETVTTVVTSVVKTVLTSSSVDENETESVETTVTERKKKKKSSTLEGGEVVTNGKTKKTKKKKTEEKENHISVITNGHHHPASPEPLIAPLSPTSQISVKEDDLSNICVKDLKLNYVNEATKSTKAHPSEIPVPPPVSIRELRRSFGDLHKACENLDANVHDNNQIDLHSRARSLGDLSRIDRPRSIVTGVSVKELAANYWRTISIENNLNEQCGRRVGRLEKSSFSKFDQLSKKSTVLHVRSSGSEKASKTFNQTEAQGTNPSCKACSKTVFAMEQIKAERAVWHKNCFRCQTCKKQLTVDIYSSHEGELYCKPHFKELFQPKAVVETEEPVRRRKPEMIIRENQPIELPPDVVRASDKPDLGLEELSSLNVKSRFQVFEKGDNVDGDLERSPTQVSVKRSSSILSKLAKFQKKGMDVGVSDDALNGFVYEGSSSSSEEDEDENEEEEETGVIKCRRKMKERPMSFGKIDDVKKNWECATDQDARKEMWRELKREELQNLRSRLFMGKQGKMKEMYEQAVADSEGKTSRKDSDGDVIRSENAKLVKERFEKGEVVHSDSDEESRNKKTLNEDMSVFEEGISKKSRSIFLEMDASVAKTASVAPVSPAPQKEMKPRIPRETDSPEREIYRDPMVVRCDDKQEEEATVLKSQTTSKMLSMFRQLEEQKEVMPDGPKPKKCFTPPPDYRGSETEEESEEEYDDEDDEEEEEESEGEDGIVKSSYKVKDEFLDQARNAAKARQLAAKFEQWEPEKNSANNAVTMLDSEHASIESTKSLKAKFESLKTETPTEKSRPKVNRFVRPANKKRRRSSANHSIYITQQLAQVAASLKATDIRS